jgi:dephospho-CoA kinase
MIKIGLTGGIASGKSSVAQILIQDGIKVINADDISHRLLEKGTATYRKILEIFSADILENDGTINRKNLGHLVFNNNEALKNLEQILHPVIIQEIIEQMRLMANAGFKIVVAEVPLLFEVGMEELFDYIWVVSATPDEQLQRIINRDKLSAVEAKQRLNNQLPLTEKEKRAHVVIYNNKDIHSLEIQIKQLLKTLE